MLSKAIIFLVLTWVSMCSAVDWYHFIPYNTSTCSGANIGLGYSIKGDGYCQSGIEGTYHAMTTIVAPANTSVKIQFYQNTNPKVCASPTLSSTYTLNTCQDSLLQGFNMDPNGLWYARQFYVNKTGVPYYPTSAGAQSNMLFTMYNLGCTTILSYAYFVGYQTLVDPNDPDISYNYYCSGGTPYREYCENPYGCDSPQDLSQSCYANYSYFLARTITCV
ncbi:hypothetical protein DLAC_06462 [Tieghemostelium lacteum]|uniref:Carbohydrate binding domain-containing protein n=1 Tax=Tieghemostelium lacteum TaxID=361077 RepID=A0A151ZET9_TIELA|nr:hypothetical protein DLAC_06462 [Tieghemostelium lacteum]|eukprot:KYQ92478.1 hypothetical protein DLAC_06462 [Tieghemostelium lacteum]